MKLRVKVLLFFGSLTLLICSGVYFYSRASLLNNYQKFEASELIHDTIQAKNILRDMFSTLTVLTANWSAWDDLYKFMHDKNDPFIQSNITIPTFENSKINLMLFFDAKGKFFYGKGYDPASGQLIPPSSNLLNQLTSDRTFTHDTANGKVGIVKTPEKYIVLSAMPILTSEGKGPSAGTIIFGYFLNENQFLTLSEVSASHVQFFPLPIENNSPTLKDAYTHLEKGTEYYFSPVNENLAYGFTFINDIEKKPIGILTVLSDRGIYKQAVTLVNRYLLIITAIDIFFLIVFWLFLKIYVLDRIIKVSRQVSDIYSGSKFSKHIAIKGNDEISQMVSSINSLMDIIQLSEEQLKYRLSLGTEELDKISRLNKNLVSEINHHKQNELKLKEEEQSLRHMAYYDVVANLPNRIYFNELLEHIMIQSARNEEQFAVLFIDIDKFKQINDTYGHDVGDQVLQHTAKQLKKSVRENDVVARLAGDEFIMILKHTHKKELIINLIEKMFLNLSTPLVSNINVIQLTYSIGISIYPTNGNTPGILQKHADLAMYYAKKQTGNTYRFYDETNSSDNLTPKT